MAISRMQQPKQLMSNGGILTLADAKRMAPPGESLAYINKDEAKLLKSRGGAGEDINGTGIKSYFLKKAFKKATRAVKKVVKSPIGKMALIGAAGFGIPGTDFGGLIGRGAGSIFGPAKGIFGNAGGISSVFGKGAKFSGIGDMFRKGGESDADVSYGRLLAGGLGATALAAPFLAGKEEEPEEVGEVMDVANIRNRAQNFYSGMGDKGVGLNFMPKKKYVDQNFYAADGGRAGYAMGGDIDEEDEIAFARSGAGQSRRQPMAFLNMGGDAGNAQAEQMLMAEFVKYKNKGGDLSFEQFVKAVMQQQEQTQGMEQPMMAADGGMAGMSVPGYGTPAGTNKFGYPSGGVRVGKADGGQLVSPSNDGSRPGYAGESNIGILDVIKSFPGAVKEMFTGETGAFLGDNQAEKNKFMVQDMFPDIDKDTFSIIIDMNNKGMGIDEISSITGQDSKTLTDMLSILNMKAYGGRIGRAEGGIMNTDEASEMIDMGGQEKDYRDEGGFVAMGGEERADDVPARLSKNEFVFTADAVRNAGGGDIDRGSEVMQNLMDNLEQGGQISEDSQGLGGEEIMSEEMIEEPNGAQAMYEQQQALQSRMA